MPIKINCPNCSKELNAPDALLGKLAACPRCSTQFPVTPQPQPVVATPSQSITPNYYPPGVDPPVEGGGNHAPADSNGPQPTSPQPPTMPTAVPFEQTGSPAMMPPVPTTAPTNEVQPRTAQPILQRPAELPMVPPVSGTAPTTTPQQSPLQSPAISPSIPPTNHLGVASPTQPSSQSSSDPPVAQPSVLETETEQAGASPLRKPSERKVKAARFVSGGATTTRINLGEDGKLPDLVVDEENQKPEHVEQAAEQGRPLLLAVVLSLSVIMSLAMFFIQPDGQESLSERKAKTRQHLEEFYIGEGANLKPYQKLLRDALVRSRHGDEPGARRRYRRVLDMLHADDQGNPIGLVGRKVRKSPPSDFDLTKHLKILLSDR